MSITFVITWMRVITMRNTVLIEDRNDKLRRTVMWCGKHGSCVKHHRLSDA